MSCVVLTREQEIEAFNAGNFDLLILSVIPLAIKVGRKIAREVGYDTDDAGSLATLAVCRSVRKFDPTRNYRLSTFIWRCVSSYVRRAISRDLLRHSDINLVTADGKEPDVAEVLAREQPESLKEEKKLYWQAIKTLPARERMILERRRAGHTFRKIAADTGLGRSRVGQVYKETINDLRSKFQPVM